MTGCTYCGTHGCEWETCPERLEDRHGVPSDYDDEGQLKTDGGSEEILGFVIGPDEDAVTVCADCADDEDESSSDWGVIRDGPHYGDRVPYPECYVCDEVMRPDDDREVRTDGGTDSEVRTLSLEELREEYQHLLDQAWGLERLTEEDRSRLRKVWNELKDRTGVEQPACPECGARDWGQSPGDPKHCNGCHLELGMNHADLVEEIDAAWEQILHAECNGGDRDV